MRRIYLTQRLILAAGTAGRVTFAPPNSSDAWVLVSVSELPNASVTADDTDYATRGVYNGSTLLMTAVTTKVTGGTALAQGTAVNLTLSGVGSQLETSQAAPFTYRVSHSGAGKAVDVSVVACWEPLR